MSLFANGQGIPGLPGKIMRGARRLLPKTPAGWLAWGLAPVAVTGSLLVMADAPAASAAFKKAELAPATMSAAPAVEKPAMVLALSVEYPTVGAQYRDAEYTPAS